LHTETRELTVNTQALTFLPVSLIFQETAVSNRFALKNNKTLSQTLSHRRYIHLKLEVEEKYGHTGNEKLGAFLTRLKNAGDPFYLKFLNRYRDKTYCSFTITEHLKSKGLYIYTVRQEIKYIGKSTDSFQRRINRGYGRISPKNCYLDGQSTNCHLNALINENRDGLAFYICPLEDNATIDYFERMLIQKHQPEWNIALKANRT
jgi:hypothetical protein